MKNPGKIYKNLSFIFGTFGGVVSLFFAYLQSDSIITVTKYSNIKYIYFFRHLLLYWSYLFIVCFLLYAIGHIMEILQSIDKNITTLLTTKDNNDIWRRPNCEDNKFPYSEDFKI